MGCSSVPADIRVSGLPLSIPEGTATPVEVSALDKKGTALPAVDVAWTVTPEGGASRAGEIVSFLKEGIVEFRWTTEGISRIQQVVVLSPLIGEYERESQPAKGMRIRFRNLDDRVIAEITRPPTVNEESAKWHNDQYYESWILPAAEKQKRAQKSLECLAGDWAVGLRKMDDVRRLKADTWEAQSLTQQGAVTDGPGATCSKEGRPHSYASTTIKREADGTLVVVVPTITDESRGAKQRWKPVP